MSGWCGPPAPARCRPRPAGAGGSGDIHEAQVKILLPDESGKSTFLEQMRPRVRPEGLLQFRDNIKVLVDARGQAGHPVAALGEQEGWHIPHAFENKATFRLYVRPCAPSGGTRASGGRQPRERVPAGCVGEVLPGQHFPHFTAPVYTETPAPCCTPSGIRISCSGEESELCGRILSPFCSKMAFREFCPSWHGNHTHHFYAELENFGKGNVYESSVMLVCVVLGLVITISCVTIILAKKAWRLQPRRRHCLRRYYRGDAEADQDYQEHSFCRRGIHCACSLRGNRFSSLHRLHMDAPPSYEECMGPEATQLYPPTEAPPPYSLIDTNSGHSSGGHQQAHSDLFTVSMDALPPYEAVCGPCPPPSLLPLPGSEPEPSSLQGPPSPKGSLASSPEMIV